MDHVLIADEVALQDKIAHFQRMGIEQLCVVSDWDRTLTKARTEDGQDATSYSVIAHGAYLGEAYRVEMDRLYARYRPIEISQAISHRKKQKAMRDWWMAALEMMQKYGLTDEIIEDIAVRDFMRLRDGASISLTYCQTEIYPCSFYPRHLQCHFKIPKSQIIVHLKCVNNRKQIDIRYTWRGSGIL